MRIGLNVGGAYPGPATGSGRAAVSGTAKLRSDQDEQVARLFKHMRLATRMPPSAIAQHLGISERMLALLEDGASQGLGRAPEAQRIVTVYSKLVGIDCSPILQRIMAQHRPAAATGAPQPTWLAPGRAATQPAASPVYSSPNPVALPAVRDRQSSSQASPAHAAPARQRRRSPRLAFVLAAVPMLLVGALWYAVADPGRVHSAIEQLPRPVSLYARSGLELLLVTAAPLHGGLPLIDTGDPTSRKSDRLSGR